MFSTQIFALYWLFGTIALAQSPSASFAYPRTTTPVLIVNFVDTVVVEWDSNFQEAYLWLFCGNDRWANIRVATSGNTSFSPSVDIKVPRDWTQPYNCHFDLNYRDEYRAAVNGPIFNITSIANQEPTLYALQTTTAILPVDTSRSTVVSTTGTNNADGQSSATTSPPIPTTIEGPSHPTGSQTGNAGSGEGKKGLSMGVVVGIAIGAIAGCIVLLGVGVVVGRNKRKVDMLDSPLSGAHGDEYASPPTTKTSPPLRHTGRFKQRVPMELEPYHAPQELEGSNVVVNKPPASNFF